MLLAAGATTPEEDGNSRPSSSSQESFYLLFDGSKMNSPPLAGLALIVTVPLTLASSRDEVTEGAPPHPRQAIKTSPATGPTILRFALAMTVSTALSVSNDHHHDDGE